MSSDISIHEHKHLLIRAIAMVKMENNILTENSM